MAIDAQKKRALALARKRQKEGWDNDSILTETGRKFNIGCELYVEKMLGVQFTQGPDESEQEIEENDEDFS